jgi:hypothetical protein
MIAEILEFPVRVRRAVHGCQLRSQKADLLGFVTDPLEIGNRLDNGDDQPQVAGRRRPCRQNPAASFVDFDFEQVDLVVVTCDLETQLAVAADYRGNRLGQLRLDQPAHGHNAVPDALQVLVEAPGCVVSQVGCLHDRCGLKASGL